MLAMLAIFEAQIRQSGGSICYRLWKQDCLLKASRDLNFFYIIAALIVVGGYREPAASEYGSGVQVFKPDRLDPSLTFTCFPKGFLLLYIV